MSGLKIAALLGFILWAVVEWAQIAQPGPHGGPSGAGWGGSHSGGFFPTGIGGTLKSMLVVIFAYAGIGVFATAAPQMHKKQDIDRAAWATMVILTVLYVVSVGLLLFILPWQQIDTSTSPFVAALQRAGWTWLAQIINGVVLVASFSVMAGAVFSAIQILGSLGELGNAPRFVTLKAGNGTHYGALLVTAVLIETAIVVSHILPSNVYNFLISSSSFFTFLNWSLILLAFLSWRRRGHGKDRISSLAFGQPVSTIIMLLFIAVLTVYALMEPDQRTGFYTFAGLVMVISGLYLLVRRRLDHVPD